MYNFLGPAKFHLMYWRPDASDNDNEGGSAELKSIRTCRFGAKEELFLTLLKLRRGFAHQTIAYIYGISVPLVSRIFITWIQFIYLHFRELKSLMFQITSCIQSKQQSKSQHFWETEQDLLRKRKWIPNALQKQESILTDSMNV